MHQRKLAAKPQAKYTPPNRKAKSPSYLESECPKCHGPKFGKIAKLCRKCDCASRRPPVDTNLYRIRGHHARRIYLTRGQSTFVDAKLYEWLMLFSWSALKKAGRNVYYPQARAYCDGKRVNVSMHHLVLGVHHSIECDHKNGDTLDNLTDNLRPCNDLQNAANQGTARNNTSGFKGVIWRKDRKRWKAVINVNGKRHHLGTFRNIEDAAKCYDTAALKYFGEFARLNFPSALRVNSLQQAHRMPSKRSSHHGDSRSE